MRNLLTPLAAFVFIAALATAARAEDVVDPQVGYTLRLPDGWRRVPDAALQKTIAAMMKPGAAGAPKFVAAFEPAAHVTHFQYPYAMVQVHDYGQGMSLATISRAEIEDMVSKMTGVPASKLKQVVTDDMAKLVGDVSMDSPSVVTTPPGFVAGSTLNAPGIGKIRGRSVCVLGRTNAVYVHFYARESDWQRHAGTVEQLAAGLRRTADQTVAFGDATRTTSGRKVGGGFDWGRVWSKALAGAVIGGVIGLVTWAIKRGKQAGGGR